MGWDLKSLERCLYGALTFKERATYLTTSH
jgi:hypothetical protein